MKKRLTISRSLYGVMQKNDGWMNKADMMLLDVYHEKEGKKVRANADSIRCAARKLTKDGWFEQKEVGGSAWYRVKPEEPDGKEPQVLPSKPVPMRLGDNDPIAVPPEAVGNLLAHGWVKV